MTVPPGEHRAGLSIRPFTAEDYEAVARIHNASFAPDFTRDADKLRHDDHTRPAYCRAERWVAMVDGSVVGFAQYEQQAWRYDPHKFDLHFAVEPAFTGRGIGRALYDQVLAALAASGPFDVSTWSREDMAARVRFLDRRGFQPGMRLLLSELDLTSFDASPFQTAVDSVVQQGISVRTLAELDPGQPTVQRKLYELWLELRQDVPLAPDEQRTDVPFEVFWASYDGPTLLPPGYFIALDGEQYVGTSALWRSPSEPEVLRTSLTAVRRAHPRRGIATGPKVRSLRFAQRSGFRRAYTDNETNNRGTLAINERMGFTKRPAWLRYSRSVAR